MMPTPAPGYLWLPVTNLPTPLPRYTCLALNGRTYISLSIWLALYIVRRWLRRALGFMAALATSILWNAIWDMTLALHRNRPARGVVVGDLRQLALFEEAA